MIKYTDSNSIERAGIHYVGKIVAQSNLIFRETSNDDIGIDGMIEIIKNNNPTNNFISVQVKSGKSYFQNNDKHCVIPVGDHYEYWKNHNYPVFGIVYNPKREKAYFLELRGYLKTNMNCKQIKFDASDRNEFNYENLKKIIFNLEKEDDENAKVHIVEEMHEKIVNTYVKPIFRNLEFESDSDIFDLYSNLFKYICTIKKRNEDISGYFGTNNEFFEEFFKIINAFSSTENEQKYLLLVCGLPGAGKSSFLSLLYLYIFRKYQSENYRKIPIYINLHHYDGIFCGIDIEKNKGRAKEALLDDMKPLMEINKLSNRREIVFIIDGLDKYYRSELGLYNTIRDVLNKMNMKTKIIGLGTQKERNINLKKNQMSFPGLGLPLFTVEFKSVIVNNSKYFGMFVDAYCKTQKFRNTDCVEPENLKKAILRYKLQEVDLFLMSILFQRLDENSETLSDLFAEYCKEIIDDGDSFGVGVDKLTVAAELAFRYKNNDRSKISSEDVFKNPGWSLMHLNSALKSFLIGYYVAYILASLGEAPSDKIFEQLSFVYPYEVNSYCKEIINKDVGTQKKIFQAIKSQFENLDVTARTHACYVLGRFTNHAIRNEAKKFLQNLLSRFEEKDQLILHDKKTIVSNKSVKDLNITQKKDLLLIRTVYISLTILGDDIACRNYLKAMLTNPLWDDLNRGFHLQYYGDVEIDIGDLILLDGDNIELNISKTFFKLYAKIKNVVNEPDKYYNLFNIELYTLCSLIQHRHVEGLLSDEYRDLMNEVLKKDSIKELIMCDELKKYLFMISKNLASNEFSLGNIIDNLYNLKESKRSGWREKGDIVEGEEESIADHIVGARLLLLILLPDEKPMIKGYEEYDKRKIMNMIDVHDIAEAYTGDITPKNKTEEEKDKERKWIGYISKLGTYSKIADLSIVEELWEEFEANLTINARIAKEFDKLDNLVQLYKYIDEKKYKIDDATFLKWEKILLESIKTEIGIEAKEIIVKYYKKKKGVRI